MKRILCLVLLLGPGVGFAQDATTSAAPTKDKEAVTFNEIERGFNVGASGGPLFFFNAPKGGPFSPGQTARVEVGYDISSLLTVSLFLMGTANRAGSDYLGDGNQTNPASGDYSALIPGAMVRINFLGIPDSQDVKRTWIFARGGVGFTTFFPKNLLGNSDVMAMGGIGVEYYTHLRHFSIGVEADGVFLLGYGSLGAMLVPNLRYAF